MLTRKQQELLVFINERLNKDGISPSFDEMKDALRLKSKSGIHRLISGLEERGFIRRLAHRARALEVIRLPETTLSRAVESVQKNAGLVGEKISGAVNRAAQTMNNVMRETMVQLPMLGRIAAGTAIEALRDNSRFVDVPLAFLGRGDHYVLEVSGDSMVEAGIHDGDSVIIEQCDVVDNGTITVALIDHQEVTLKSFYKKGSVIDLVPANHSYKTMTYPSERVQVQGKLVGLMRKY